LLRFVRNDSECKNKKKKSYGLPRPHFVRPRNDNKCGKLYDGAKVEE